MTLIKGHERISEVREAAAECFVLMQNPGQILPLRRKDGSPVRTALFGSGQICTVKGGTGSGDVNNLHTVNILDGFRNNKKFIVDESIAKIYETWIKENHLDVKVTGTERCCYEEPDISEEIIRQAAHRNEAAVMVISRISGENADRIFDKGDYFLQEGEEKILNQLCRWFDEVTVLLNTGGVIDTSCLVDRDIAVLFVGQPGQEAGNAAADVVCGDKTPSGKLTDTWGAAYEDYPGSCNFGIARTNDNWNPMGLFCGENRPQACIKYEEDIFVGYRYFDTWGKNVNYPFGSGLSYTQFEYEVTSRGWESNTLTCICRVINVGDEFSGREVLQAYVSIPEVELEQSYSRLAGFVKTPLLGPGESCLAELKIDIRDLVSYSEEKHSYLLEPGYYDIYIGNSSRNTHIAASIYLEQEQRLCEVKNLGGTPSYGFKRYSHKGIMPVSYPGEEIERRAAREKAFYADSGLLECRKVIYRDTEPELLLKTGDFTFDDLMEGRCTVQEFTAQMTEEDLARLTCGMGLSMFRLQDEFVIGDVDGVVPGAAGVTANMRKEYHMGSVIMADGPAGIRLRQEVPDPDGGVMMYQNCTAYPVGTLLACSWDIELLERIGDMAGREMTELGIELWLAPGMNIHRDPLCGRNFEYFSEDAYLTGKCAEAITKGVQKNGVGVTIKHFACNNQEDMRANSTSEVSERALREIYLSGFERVIKNASPWAVMTAYNDVNGTPCADNYDLCTAIARDEWGFDGLIMTDWGGGISNPAISMYAGNDLIMPGGEEERKKIRDCIEGREYVSRGASGFSCCTGKAHVQRAVCNIVRCIQKAKTEKYRDERRAYDKEQ